MPSVIQSIEAEFRRYKSLAEGAFAQLDEPDLIAAEPGGGNSVAVLVWHISGNLASRFTEFLTADGEKPWRQRESEFEPRSVTRSELVDKWEGGWNILFSTFDDLDDSRLHDTVTIREQSLTVLEALHRSLAHVAYHVGQIVFLAKSFRGERWHYLSIPPGGSEDENRSPASEKPADHAAALARRRDRH